MVGLVTTDKAQQFLSIMQLDVGRNAYLGAWEGLHPVPAGALMQVHHAVGDAVKRVSVLHLDKSRTPAQLHNVGRKLAEAAVAEIHRGRAALTKWSIKESEEALAQIDKALSPEINTAAQIVRSDIRQFVRTSMNGDKAAEFAVNLPDMIKADKQWIEAICEAPAALSGLSPERVKVLRMDAALAHAPEASMRIHAAAQVGKLDAQLASVAADIPLNFYSAGIEAGMNSRVADPTEVPLSTGEGQ